MRRLILIFALVTSTFFAGTAREVTITILATTDIHGNITGKDYIAGKKLGYGLVQAAPLIEKLRKSKDDSILVDCGDTFVGNPLTFYHHFHAIDEDNPVVTAMRMLKYDVAVPGNHDFDYGTSVLKQAASKTRFPWISANILDKAGQPLFPGTLILERTGVKVGFFGLTTPATALLETPEMMDGTHFLDMAESAKKAVKDLKQQGADIIIGLVHSGKGEKLQTGQMNENEVYHVVENVPGIDAILFGHTHKEVRLEMYNGVLLCQPKDHAESIGVILVDLQQRDGKWEILGKSSTTLKVDGTEVNRKIEKKLRSLDKGTENFMDSELGEYRHSLEFTKDPLTPTTASFFTADAMQSWKSSDIQLITVSNPGMKVKSKRAKMINTHIFKLLPYDNYLLQVPVTGTQLKALMEHAASMLDSEGKLKSAYPFFQFGFFIGADYAVHPVKAEGNRVEIRKIGDKPFKTDAHYTVDLTAYIFGGGGGYFNTANRPSPTAVSTDTFRNIMTSYIEGLQKKNEE
ncbi:MAG: 5'-nucleotidase C-terminal domain-containing protein [Holophagae bacterium]|nr:5'-nucleotidase C-terminal domain-containing protein [Holophagae bacterium]